MKVNSANVIERPYEPRLEVVKTIKVESSLVQAKQVSIQDRPKHRDNSSSPFKDWCMPEQPSGYIKAREYDYL